MKLGLDRAVLQSMNAQNKDTSVVRCCVYAYMHVYIIIMSIIVCVCCVCVRACVPVCVCTCRYVSMYGCVCTCVYDCVILMCLGCTTFQERD